MAATAFIVLAAGTGSRMASDQPKVLHRAGGCSLLGHVLSAVKAVEPTQVCVVVGPDMAAVADEAATVLPNVRSVIQDERNGTAHATCMAKDALQGFDGTIVVMFGDGPLIRPETLKALVSVVENGADMALLGFEAADPHGYGRFILEDGALKAIREEKDASDAERKITLCNSGVTAAGADLLWPLLARIDNDNAQGEYYLTELVELAVADGRQVAHTICSEQEVQGVNSRAQLAAIEARLQDEYRDKAMAGGATLIAPQTVFLSHDTTIGRDVVIEPHVVMLDGVTIGDGAVVRAFSHLEGAEIGPGCVVGPYARLRPGARLAKGAKVGNFVEIKNADLEQGSKVNHLTYIGDARVGQGANVGAGTITCNYDGFNKHFTDIGKGAFVGSNSALVAPVKIGDGAFVGSGSVVTRDVPEGALTVARGRQEDRPGWAVKFRAMQSKSKKKS